MLARGDFISLSRECKDYFRTKAKKGRHLSASLCGAYTSKLQSISPCSGQTQRACTPGQTALSSRVCTHAPCGQTASSQRSFSVGSNGVFIGFEFILFDLFLQRFSHFFLSKTIFMPNEKKLFCRKTLAFAYSDMLKSPLAARGDFISLSRECKDYFRTKAKKWRAPKCPPLWSLPPHEVRLHRTHLLFRSNDARNTIALCKALYAKRFRFRECFSAEDFDCAAFDEEFNEVVHCLGKISKRWRIATFISCFLTFLLRFLVNNLRARAEKTFFAKKLLTRKKTYVTIYRPLGPGGILSHFREIASFFFEL